MAISMLWMKRCKDLLAVSVPDNMFITHWHMSGKVVFPECRPLLGRIIG